MTTADRISQFLQDQIPPAAAVDYDRIAQQVLDLIFCGGDYSLKDESCRLTDLPL
jgi:hypothetical protein